MADAGSQLWRQLHDTIDIMLKSWVRASVTRDSHPAFIYRLLRPGWRAASFSVPSWAQASCLPGAKQSVPPPG